jgi:serpin B
MKNELRIAAGIVVAVVTMAGCGSGAVAVAPPVMAHGVAIREPLADPRPYGVADTAFGLDVLTAWCRADPRANLLLSPSSLASGLGMAYLGARGGTAQAMARVLDLPGAAGPAAGSAAAGGTTADPQALEAGLQARSAALRGLDGPGVTLNASDLLWADPTLPARRSYLNAVATSYDAGVAQAPLRSHPDQAAQEINHAIAVATSGQIPQLLPPGSLSGIGWVLTDALYLRAAWATPFQASQTSPGPFTTAAGQQVSVPFMRGGRYRTVSAAGWTAVALPYRGGKLTMIALLPPAGATGCALPSVPGLTTMAAHLASTAGVRTRAVALPRANLSVQVSMKALLAELGMGVAFTSRADFSGLSPQAGSIGLVQQAATLRVGEQGTVASAATAVGLMPTAVQAPLPQVSFDRPYLMLVTATGSAEPLFLARVANPAALRGPGVQEGRVLGRYIRTEHGMQLHRRRILPRRDLAAQHLGHGPDVMRARAAADPHVIHP